MEDFTGDEITAIYADGKRDPALMNAAETIAAAIRKLETQRDATPVGKDEWVRASKEDSREDVVVTTGAGDWIIRDSAMNFADADLIVTLHRTMDAQLEALRSAQWLVSGPGASPVTHAHAATWSIIKLAEAIVGREVS